MSPENHDLKGARIYRSEDPLPYYKIDEIRDDLGSSNLLSIISQSQRDSYLTMTGSNNEELSIGFVSLTGGPYISPVIAERIREIAQLIALNQGQIPIRPMPVKEFPPVGNRESRGMKIKVQPDGLMAIKNIRGDQGHDTKMDLLITPEGDSIVTLREAQDEQFLEMQFNSSIGGGAFPGISYILRGLARDLAVLEDY